MLTDLTPQFESADRILVFGGPYSNLEATRSMRREARRLGIPSRHTICTGDVVAYCAHPAETIGEIRSWGLHTVAGNCEQQLAAGADNCACGFEKGGACDVLAEGWYSYAAERVSHDDRQWMGSLPGEAWLTWAGRTIRIVHGACSETSKFIFASNRNEIAAQLAGSGTDIVICGHSGIPFGHHEGDQFWFNAGVIGQPANDGTPDGWYGMLTRVENGITFSLHRLAYDFSATRAAVLDAGYADPYGTSLGTGIWPNDEILPAHEKTMTGHRLAPRTFEFAATPRRMRAA